MLEYKVNTVKITCDKCGRSDEAAKNKHDEIFYFLGWLLTREDEKSIYLCENCKKRHQK